MKGEFLSPAAVKKLTGRTKYKAQLRHLAKLGIEAFPDADGQPVVLWSAVTGTIPKKQRKKGPNWDAMNGSKTAPS